MAEERPNLVVFYLDDLGYGDLGCYGSDTIRTPHIDALAADGVRFTNWYACSPVCSPSRAALLTGRYPTRAGVPHILGGSRKTSGLPVGEVTLADILKGQGYSTALMGKWHLGLTEECRPNARGFDEFYGFLAGCVDYYSHIFYWQMYDHKAPVHDLWHNNEEVWQNGDYLTEVITRRSVDFIEQNADADKPFFLYAAYNAPHYPMHAPQEYLDRYPDLPWDKRIMAAMVSAVDDGVGEIVRTLKERGLYDNTVIFFSSDNGPSTEDRNWLDGTEDFYYGGSAGVFRGHKGSLFEGGIREPAILTWPSAFKAGQTCNEMCASMDILPTFLDAIDCPLPEDTAIDGESLLPMLASQGASPHERLYFDYAGQLAVREGPWKLVLDGKLDFSRTQSDPVHLSNLDDDPGERVNLVEKEPKIARRLTEDVRAWQRGIVGEGE